MIIKYVSYIHVLHQWKCIFQPLTYIGSALYLFVSWGCFSTSKKWKNILSLSKDYALLRIDKTLTMPWLQVYYRNKRVLLYISSIKNTRVICIFYLSFIELSIQIFSQISLSDLLINTFQKWYRLLTKFTLYKILYSSIGKKLSTVQVKL